jgi:hypothetical protein
VRKIATLSLIALLTLSSQNAFAVARAAIGHFAPFASSIDGTGVDVFVDGLLVLENVKYKDFVDYQEFAAGTYQIDVYLTGLAGSTDPVLSQEFTLEDGVDYSIIAIGNGTTQDLDVLTLIDSPMDPMMGNLNIRVVHAAPFAEDLEDTEVSIRTAGGDVVNGLVGVPYEASSGFFEVPAGTYDLKVASNDGSVNYIDPLPADLPADANITVYAVGDGINQPLGIIAFPVGELPTRTPVDNRSNGTWGILEGSGTGFLLQPVPSQNRLTGFWFRYDDAGNPVFLTFDSCLEQSVENGQFVCSTPGDFDGVMAKTSLYLNTGGGDSSEDVVVTEKIGEIDFEILDCDNATATVMIDGEEMETYTAVNLTRPIPCEDES